MLDLSNALIQAWRQVFQNLKNNPDQLQQRINRCRSGIVSHPIRPWCLALRASDRRIPLSAMYRAHGIKSPAKYTAAIEITADLLLQLNRPVQLPSPGIDVQDAARLLGRHPSAFITARINGQFRTHHRRGLSGKHGPPIPLIYTPTLLDPCAASPSTPANASDFPLVWNFGHPILPHNFTQQIIRVPIYRPVNFRNPNLIEKRPRKLPTPQPDYVWYKWKNGKYVGDNYDRHLEHQRDLRRARAKAKLSAGAQHRGFSKTKRSSQGSLHFAGWNFLCPSCKKPVRILYLPLPPINLHRILQDLKIPQSWQRELDETADPPIPSLACRKCHNLRLAHHSKDAWNQLVTHLSRGWLYGHEVPQPHDYQPPHRKRKFRPRLRKAPRRQAVLRRLLNGWTVPQIAKDLHMSPIHVYKNIQTLCQMEHAKDRAELAKKHGSPHPQPLPKNKAAALRRHQVITLYFKGETHKQIARALSLTLHRVRNDIRWHYKNYNLKGYTWSARKALARKLGFPEPLSESEQLTQQIGALRQSGMSRQDIAKHFDFTLRHVDHYLQLWRSQPRAARTTTNPALAL